MANFKTSQVIFEMCIRHKIIAKILYPKPRKWARADILVMFDVDFVR